MIRAWAIALCAFTAWTTTAAQTTSKEVFQAEDGRVVEGTALATKADLEATEASLRADLGETKTSLRAEIKTAETSLRADLKTTETTLRSEIEATETTLRAEIKASETSLRSEMQVLRSEMRWMFGLLTAAFLAVAGFFWKTLWDMKAQLSAIAERLRIATPIIDPMQDEQGRLDLTPAGNKTESGR